MVDVNVNERTAESLKELSKISGVDFVSLRYKYLKVKTSSIKYDNDLEQSKNQNSIQNDQQKLDNYIICIKCNGNGIIKTTYNFMVLEKDCEVSNNHLKDS